jgi:hypothetical protein
MPRRHAYLLICFIIVLIIATIFFTVQWELIVPLTIVTTHSPVGIYTTKSIPTMAPANQSKVIECYEHSDLTSYCLYENVCLRDNHILFLTNDKERGKSFQPNGNINNWDHMEMIGNAGVDNPLPFRSFLPGTYESPALLKEADVFHEGCSAIMAFDFEGANIFHWSMKVSPSFLFLRDRQRAKRLECEAFNRVTLLNRRPDEVSDWQQKFLEISTSFPSSSASHIQYDYVKGKHPLTCYKKLFIPGTALYLFTGPSDANDFRSHTSRVIPSISFKRRRVILVKRKNRNIVNHDEVEAFLKKEVGADNVDVVSLESIAFEQQVQIMSQAALLVATHGAGLTNGVFLPPTAAVIEITAPHFAYPLYERITQQSGHFFFRLTTSYDDTLHASLRRYATITARECFKDFACIIAWKDVPIKVDISQFAVLFKQVREVLLPLDT